MVCEVDRYIMDRITVKEYRGILKILRSEYFFSFSRSFFLLKCLEEKKILIWVLDNQR